jgi:hypothetical protein
MQRVLAYRFIGILILLAFIASACASSGVGKAVQAADAQKQLVERAAVEFVKLKLRGDARITPAVYEQGRAAYEKYQGAQAGLAEALSSWKVVSSAANEAKLQTALAEVTKSIDFYLALVGKFVDLNKIKAEVK